MTPENLVHLIAGVFIGFIAGRMVQRKLHKWFKK